MNQTPPPLPVDEPSLNRLLIALENDQAALGWDQPAKLYAVIGDISDPRFDLIADLGMVHPCDALQQMYDDGMRLRPEVIGLALAHEGWRHLSLEELEKAEPSLVGGMRKAAEPLAKAAGLDLDQIMQRAHESFILGNPRVSQLPENLRVELRSVMVTFRDGTTAGVSRDRDGEPVLLGTQSPEMALQSRVPTHMWQFLNDKRPEND